MRATEASPGGAAVSAEEPRRQLLAARDLTYGALFGALALALPIAFHLLGAGLGPVLLPMYLPLLALGLLAPWRVALPVACLTPFVSALLTGMPPLAPPIAVLMAVELAALVLAAGLCRGAGLGVWPAALAGVLASRLCGALLLLAAGSALHLPTPPLTYLLLTVAVAWPGVALQLTVVPGAVIKLEQGSIIGSRFARK